MLFVVCRHGAMPWLCCLEEKQADMVGAGPVGATEWLRPSRNESDVRGEGLEVQCLSGWTVDWL